MRSAQECPVKRTFIGRDTLTLSLSKPVLSPAEACERKPASSFDLAQDERDRTLLRPVNSFYLVIRRALLLLLVCAGLVHAEKTILILPFDPDPAIRKWEWVGPALEESCRRNFEQWPGLLVWPWEQEPPDSASAMMERVLPSDSLWGNAWRLDYIVTGQYRVKGERIEVDLRVRSLRTGIDSVRLSGPVQSVQALCADVCRRAAASIGYSLRKQDRQMLSAPVSPVFAAHSAYAVGYGSLTKGHIPTAVFALMRAVSLDQGFAEAHNLLGIAYLRMGKKSEGVASFYKALELDPRRLQFRLDLGTAYLENKQDALSRKIIGSLDRTEAQSAGAMNLQGLQSLRQGLYNPAISHFVRALAKNPLCWNYAMNLGIAYYRAGDYASAIAEFERLARKRPADARLLTILGIAYRKAGYLKESLTVLGQAQAVEPDWPSIWMNLAFTHFQLGWQHQAESCLDRAIALDTTRAEFYSNKAIFLLATGDTGAAEGLLRKALSLDPRCGPALQNLGCLSLLRGRYKQARKELEQALLLAGSSSPALTNLGIAWIALKKPKKALAVLEEAVFVDPANFKARLLLADLYMGKGLSDRSADHLREYLDLKPQNDSARVALSQLLAAAGQKDEAMHYMETVIERNPGSTQYLLAMADLYRKFEWYPVALMKYQAVLSVEPRNSRALLGCGICTFRQAENLGDQTSELYNRSLFYIKSAATEDPKNMETRFWAGLALLLIKNDPVGAKQNWEPFLANGYKGEYAATMREYKDRLR